MTSRLLLAPRRHLSVSIFYQKTSFLPIDTVRLVEMHSLKLKIDFKCTCMSSLLTLNQNFVFWFPRHSPASLSPNSNKKRNFTKFYRPQLGSKIRNRISTIRDVFGCPRRFLAHLSGRYPRPVKFIVCLYTLCFISTSNF